MKKRFIITALSTALFLSTSSVLAFSDVKPTDKNINAITFLTETKIISGYPDGSFRPNKTINRAEMIKLLVTSNGVAPDITKYSKCFIDVQTQWYAPYICYAKAQNWISGYSDGKYKPEQTVNRVEALKMIFSSKGMTTNLSGSNPYQDVANNAWYATYVSTGKEINIIPVNDNNYQPSSAVTRSEVSEMLFRTIAIQVLNKPSYTPLDDVDTFFVTSTFNSSKGKIPNSDMMLIKPATSNTIISVPKPTSVTSKTSLDYSNAISHFSELSSNYSTLATKKSDVQDVSNDIFNDSLNIQDSSLKQQAKALYATLLLFITQCDSITDEVNQVKIDLENKKSTPQAILSNITVINNKIAALSNTYTNIISVFETYLANKKTYTEKLQTQLNDLQVKKDQEIAKQQKIRAIQDNYLSQIDKLEQDALDIETKMYSDMDAEAAKPIAENIIAGRQAEIARKAKLQVFAINNQIDQLYKAMNDEINQVK